MDIIPQFFINVLIPASLYGMVTLGFGLVTRVTRMYHLAIGALVLLSGYLLYSSRMLGLPWWAAIGVGIAAATAASWAMGALVFERLHEKRRVRVGSSVVAALALLVLVENTLLMHYGPSSKSVLHPWDTHRTLGMNTVVTDLELAMIAVSIVTTVCLWLFLKFTKRGQALRAVADEPQVASVVGIDVRQGRRVAWGIAGLTAGITGVLYALEYTLIPAQASTIAIRAFFRSAIGGAGSVSGAVLGSFLLELVEQGMAFWVSSAFKFVAVALAVATVLLWRPSGLFGLKR